MSDQEIRKAVNIIWLFSFIFAVSFGIWQWSFAAAVFMFFASAVVLTFFISLIAALEILVIEKRKR